MENMDKAGTHSTNIGADKLAENIPNAPKIVGPIWDFQKKTLWVSVVRAEYDYLGWSQ